MRILVIDDSSKNQESARQTLGADHDLTVVETFDEGLKLIQRKVDVCRMYNDAENSLGMVCPDYKVDREGFDAYYDARRKAYDLLNEEDYRTELFDVVLTDLLMPASGENLVSEVKALAGQEMPVGFGLALAAALHGVRYVGLVTDTDHHRHPMAQIITYLGTYGWQSHLKDNRSRFVINGAKVGFYENPRPAVKLSEEGRLYGKNWGLVLQALLLE